MKNLVLKDIRILGAINMLLLAAPLIFGVIGTRVDDKYMSTIIYFMAALVPVYLVIIRISINDMQSNANPLLISLPVKKFDIVKSRYITIFIYALIVTGFVFLSSNISRTFFNSRNSPAFSLTAMLFTICIILLFFSVNIPFQYYNTRKTQVFNSLFYLFIMLAPNLVRKIDINLNSNSIIQKILSLDFNLLAPLLLLISLIIYVGSSFISKTIFSRKEF